MVLAWCVCGCGLALFGVIDGEHHHLLEGFAVANLQGCKLSTITDAHVATGWRELIVEATVEEVFDLCGCDGTATVGGYEVGADELELGCGGVVTSPADGYGDAATDTGFDLGATALGYEHLLIASGDGWILQGCNFGI